MSGLHLIPCAFSRLFIFIWPFVILMLCCARAHNRDSYDIPSGCLNNEISAWLCCVYCASDKNKRFIAILLKISVWSACGNGCCPILENAAIPLLGSMCDVTCECLFFKDPVVLCTGPCEILSMRLTKLQCSATQMNYLDLLLDANVDIFFYILKWMDSDSIYSI